MVATTFTISIFGLESRIIPRSLSSTAIISIAFRACFSDLAPVHTIFPELKMRVAVFGRLSLKTRPGNLFG
jgi:hypothetical protein